jgi:hypothetical protein
MTDGMTTGRARLAASAPITGTLTNVRADEFYYNKNVLSGVSGGKGLPDIGIFRLSKYA